MAGSATNVHEVCEASFSEMLIFFRSRLGAPLRHKTPHDLSTHRHSLLNMQDVYIICPYDPMTSTSLRGDCLISVFGSGHRLGVVF